MVDLFGKSSVSESINEINNEFYTDVIELGETESLASSIRSIETCLSNFSEIEKLMKEAENLAVEWKGEAKLVFEDFNHFQNCYLRDMQPALETYKKNLALIQAKTEDIQNARTIKLVEAL